MSMMYVIEGEFIADQYASASYLLVKWCSYPRDYEAVTALLDACCYYTLGINK